MEYTHYSYLVVGGGGLLLLFWVMYRPQRQLRRRSKKGWDALRIAEHAIVNAETKEELKTANDLLGLAGDTVDHELHRAEYDRLLIKLQGKTIHYLTKKNNEPSN